MRCVVLAAVLLVGCAAESQQDASPKKEPVGQVKSADSGAEPDVSPYVACEPYADSVMIDAWPECNNWSDWWYYFN